jgi:ribosome maturation factor RimP
VLTKDGRKLTGILTQATTDFFVLEVEKTVKPEGAKRKTTVVEQLNFNYSDIKYTKYIIRFK